MTPPTSPKVHRVAVWSEEAVTRFWQYWSANPHLQQHFFSKQVGDGIVRLLRYSGRLRGQILDFGCGPGYLLESLIREPLDCAGVEFSDAAVESTNRKFAGKPNWKGATNLSDMNLQKLGPGTWDLITCIEVVEHLNDDYLHGTLETIRTLLKPDGAALITTPFNEDLGANMNYCPFCDHEFHKIQHVRQWNVDSLTAALEAEGFRVLFCAAIDLMDLQRMTLGSPRGWSPGRLVRMVRLNLGSGSGPDRVSGLKHLRRGKHLVALAEKRV